jgi:hypothetical protein
MCHDPLSLHDERLLLWRVRLLYNFRDTYVGLLELLELLYPLALLQLEDDGAFNRRKGLLPLREDTDESESLLEYSRLVLTRFFVDVGVVLLPPLQPLKEHKTTSQCSDQLFLPHN